jgi:glycosyltransferase involved in cell wall biosynthesis
VVQHEERSGYGAALKTGLRSTGAALIAMTDADGSYPDARLGELVGALRGADMAVGTRAPNDPHYPTLRRIPKGVLTLWVSWLVGRRVPDINSGFRAFRREAVWRFLPLLPDGFSFTTTVTIAALRSGLRVRWLPIETAPRRGRSKIRPVRDTLAFVQLILRTGIYFAPLRMLAPLVALLGVATVASVLYDALVLRNFTDKTLILFVFTTSTVLFTLLADMLDKRTR